MVNLKAEILLFNFKILLNVALISICLEIKKIYFPKLLSIHLKFFDKIPTLHQKKKEQNNSFTTSTEGR